MMTSNMTIFKVAAASSVYTVRDDFETAETGVENVRHPLFGERRRGGTDEFSAWYLFSYSLPFTALCVNRLSRETD